MNDHDNPDPTNDPAAPEPAPQTGGFSDELVNAVLDGEATAEEKTVVESDPVMDARLSTLRSVKDAHLAVALDASRSDPDAIDRRIAVALDVALSGTASPETSGSGTDTTVASHTDVTSTSRSTSSTMHADRSARRQRRGSILAAVAALILVVSVAGALIATRSNGANSSETAAEVRPPATTATRDRDAQTAQPDKAYGSGAADAAASGTSADQAERAPTAAGGAPDPTRSSLPSTAAGTERVPSFVDLGDFSSVNDLVAAAIDTPSGVPASLPCPSPFPQGGTVEVSVARLQGRSVFAMIDTTSPATAASTSVVVLEQSTCARVT